MGEARLRALAEAVLLPGFAGTTAPDWVRERIAAGLGGVVLFGRNIVDDEQVARLTEQLRGARADVVVGIDEEGGDVTRLDAATGSKLPGPLALGAAGDLGLTAAVGTALGARLAACGVTLDLAPCADLTLTLDDPIIGVRAFGSDPYAAGAHVGAYVRGMQSTGVAACAKHFPGHGASTTDSHFTLPVLPRTPEELRAVELVPFRAAIAAGVRSVMTGHLVVPQWGAEPATTNPTAILDVLRAELGFTGAVVTDALEMGAVAGHLGNAAGLADAAVRALRAGADSLCVGGEIADAGAVAAIVDRIVAEVRSGGLSEERLTEAAARTRGLGVRPAGGVVARDEAELGLTVARKALRTNHLPPLGERPLVVDVEVEPTIAAGPVPWGLGPHLVGLLPDGTAVRVTAAEPGDLLETARDRDVVVATRDAHRHPAVLDLIAGLVAVAAAVVHVETGTAGPELGTAGRVDTFGGSWSSLRAAAETVAAVSGRLRQTAG
ncbi:glycoside hydrolase family 3 N-terminal domain-containing protein [Actinokineospora sp. NBRC 105648]|uniref:glycoside hydrolase family 3 N-terminal domain-containing protein n=1 Tax=Actinokineospora sp. NBRC 105648 TaxID=3032206 RepID=UPI0024A034EC|nr:glycoside hydrolase family 3 N-terminal domain-containing protein [Actinokineospora sp. NBRC 105648]GLZ38798.1 beta-N-acetylhexosaminidase [Actinokineospora sp. NBRC 105648]